MTQLTYGALVKGIEGGLGDSGHNDIVTRVHATLPVLFGRGVIGNAVEGEVALPSATGFVLTGVSVATQLAKPNATGIAQYDAKTPIPVMKKGRIWVLAEQAVNPSSPVFCRYTVNGGTTAVGRFRADADTARADAVTDARWLTTTTAADQLALLEINIP